ncbi:MAG: hypothetical protein BMS9Abin34_159 [Patescibacteria group bacterium]|nr:MAG: hypothetical protein BMS9Abin34_159 [Patescibacteria group bacterium]
MSRYKPPWPTKKGKPFPQKHHILPSSRGGNSRPKNILRGIPSDDHWAWHKLFGNLTPRETVTVLLRYLLKGGKYYRFRRSINKKTSPPKAMSPDEMILAMLKLGIFPQNWIPSDEIMRVLEKKRE